MKVFALFSFLLFCCSAAQRIPPFYLNITDVSTPLNSGTYGVSSLILIQVNYNGPVDVSDGQALTLRLNIWRDSIKQWAQASYLSSGSATNSLLFGYIVQLGDYTVEPLDAYSYDAISGGMIEPAVSLCQANSSGFLSCPTLSTFLPPLEYTSLAKKTINVYAVPPTITGVSTTNAPNYYGIGSVITILVQFSEAVIVVRQRTPYNILLDSDISFDLPIPASARYVSGSGTSTLTFQYTILLGQYAFPLNYNYFTSITDMVITDTTGANEANYALPAPPNTQLAQAALVADGIPPYPTVVTTTTAAGTTLVPGSTISVLVYFSELVSLENFGNIQLVLNIGTFPITDFTGNQVLNFTFTISTTSSTTNDLNYMGTYALLPNGATVYDRAGNQGGFLLPPTNQQLSAPGQNTYSPLGKLMIQVSNAGPTLVAVTASLKGAVKVGTTFNISLLLTQQVVTNNTTPTNPSLMLTDGGTATFIGATNSPVPALVFTYTVPVNTTYFNAYLDVTSFVFNSNQASIVSLGGAPLVPTGVNFNNPNLSLYAQIYYTK